MCGAPSGLWRTMSSTISLCDVIQFNMDKDISRNSILNNPNDSLDIFRKYVNTSQRPQPTEKEIKSLFFIIISFPNNALN